MIGERPELRELRCGQWYLTTATEGDIAILQCTVSPLKDAQRKSTLPPKTGSKLVLCFGKRKSLSFIKYSQELSMSFSQESQQCERHMANAV